MLVEQHPRLCVPADRAREDLRLDVPAIYMWTTTFDANNFARGAAIGIVLLLSVGLLVIPYLVWSLRRETDL